MAGVILCHSSKVQTAVAQKVMESVKEKTGLDISFGSISFKPFNALVIKDAVLLDPDPYMADGFQTQDTVARIGSAVASFSLKGLFDGTGLYIGDVHVQDALFSYVIEKRPEYPESHSNIGRIIHTGGSSGSNFKMELRKASVRNFEVRMIEAPQKEYKAFGPCIDWTDLSAVVDAKASKVSIKDGIVKASIDEASLKEKSGFEITHLDSDLTLKDGVLRLKDTHYTDPWSRLNMPNFAMDFSHGTKDFFRDVRMDIALTASQLAMQSISYYGSGALDQNPITLDIHAGAVSGPVGALDIRHLQFTDMYSGLCGKVSGTIDDLPDTNMSFGLALREGQAQTEGLLKFISAWTKSDIKLGDIGKGETLDIDATVNGPLNDMAVKGDIRLAGGSVQPDIKLKNVTFKEPISIEGRISTENVNVGRIIGTQAVKELTASAAFGAYLNEGNPSLRLDSLKVSRLNVLDYNYSDLSAAGTFSQRAFNGRVVSADPNLHFLAQGLFNLSRKTKNAVYDFFASVGYADLHALNIDKRAVSRVSLPSLRANFTRTADKDLTGQIEATGLTLTGVDGRHNIGTISISSHSNDDVNRIKLTSSFMNASYLGTSPVSKFAKDLMDASVSRELPSLLPSKKKARTGEEYSVSFDFHNTMDLLRFVLPGAYIADGTKGQLKLEKDGTLKADIKSGRIAFKDKFLKGLDISIDNLGDVLRASITSSENHVSDDICTKDNNIELFADADSLSFRYDFDNKEEHGSHGKVLLTGLVSRGKNGKLSVKAKAQPSGLCFKGQDFKLKSGDIILEDKDIQIDDFSIYSSDQFFNVDGRISPWNTDTLKVEFSNMDLALVNAFVPMSIAGRISGSGELLSPTANDAELHFDASSSVISIGDRQIGALNAHAAMEGHEVKANVNSILNGLRNLDAQIKYETDAKVADLTADFNGFDISFAQGFVKGIFSELGGQLFGQVKASGPTNSLDIQSKGMRIADGLLRVDYTNVPYHLNGPFTIDKEGIHLGSIKATDDHSGKGTLTGDFSFGGFKNMALNISGILDNMEVFDTDGSTGEPIYGNIFGTGRMSISGPLNSLLLEADATTNRNTKLHIPLGNMTTSESTDLLRFRRNEVREEIDAYDMMMRRMRRESSGSSDFGLKLKVKATPDAVAYIDLDSNGDMGLSGTGQGDINIDLRNSAFRINGDYTLDEGDFNFAMLGIISKKFDIRSGSQIKFNGDVMESDLNIDAIYSLKTSLNTFLADTSKVSSRRMVNCGIHITDKLKNPQLGFTIDVPDLDPTSQSVIDAALNTDAKIQKQVMALLLTSSFLPDDQSGIVNNSSMYYNTVTDIMSNQLNNILQKLNIPLDLGLGYQEGSGGTDIFDVAVSTQLFNNRVVVNGTIGNKRKFNTLSRGDVVGDLDIEIKMDDNGQVRLTVFSHSSDDYTNFIDNSQRNGVGIAYQKEFTNFSEMIKELFMTRDERTEQASQRAINKEETVKIHIH
ncbi:MAG: translocation/assembly module TamB [Bacteroidales bacterium]|nr:translocation/assembly module TamB [Bacteroidales bacterium]